MSTSSSKQEIALYFFTSYPWRHVSSANWLKYPSELTPHVINVDYLSRHVDTSTGILHTERLLTCRQHVPDFVFRLLGQSDTASYVYEQSTIDGRAEILEMCAQNLTFSQLITAQERCRYMPNNEWSTKFEQAVQITGLFGGRGTNAMGAFIGEKVEEFLVRGFQANAHKGKRALEEAIQRLLFCTAGDADHAPAPSIDKDEHVE